MYCYVIYSSTAKKYVYDADFNCSPPQPCINRRKMWLFDSPTEAQAVINMMEIGGEYQVMRAEFDPNNLKKIKTKEKTSMENCLKKIKT